MMTEDMRSINKFIATMEKFGYVDRINKNILVKIFGEDTFLNINNHDNYLRLIEVFYDR
jgi:hypothetical protein